MAHCGRQAYKFLPELPADWHEDLRVIIDGSELESARNANVVPEYSDGVSRRVK